MNELVMVKPTIWLHISDHVIYLLVAGVIYLFAWLYNQAKLVYDKEWKKKLISLWLVLAILFAAGIPNFLYAIDIVLDLKNEKVVDIQSIKGYNAGRYIYMDEDRYRIGTRSETISNNIRKYLMHDECVIEYYRLSKTISKFHKIE